MKTKTKTTRTPFASWLEKKDLTIEAFVRSVPGVHYSTVAKWSSSAAAPDNVQDAHKILVRMKYPDCPILK